MGVPSLTSLHATRWLTSGAAGSITGISWSAGDIIVYFGGLFKSTGSVGTLTPSNANLTFSRHIARGNGSTLSTDYWAAVATSDQTNQTIAVSQSVGGCQGSQTLHIVTGATGYDPNASVPEGTNGAVHTSPSFSSTTANILVYLNAFQASTATRAGVPSGWTGSGGIGPSTSAGGTTPCFKTFTSVQTSQTATYTGTVTELIDVDIFTADVLTTADQTLPGVLQQEVDVTESSSPEADIAQTFFNISQSLTANDSASGAIAQTLPLLQQTINVKEVIETSLDQTLPGAIQELLVVTEIITSVITTLAFPMEQALTASVGAANHINMTLRGVLQEAIVVNEIEITSINSSFPFLFNQQLEGDQTPPTIIRQTFPGVIEQDAEFVISVDAEIDMVFPTMDQVPLFITIDMTLGGSGGGGGGTYRTWWRASCGP